MIMLQEGRKPTALGGFSGQPAVEFEDGGPLLAVEFRGEVFFHPPSPQVDAGLMGNP
jgi:hypothetical protein